MTLPNPPPRKNIIHLLDRFIWEQKKLKGRGDVFKIIAPPISPLLDTSLYLTTSVFSPGTIYVPLLAVTSSVVGFCAFSALPKNDFVILLTHGFLIKINTNIARKVPSATPEPDESNEYLPHPYLWPEKCFYSEKISLYWRKVVDTFLANQLNWSWRFMRIF